MAHFEMEFDSDYLDSLLATDFDEIAEEALGEAVPILEESMRKACRSVIEHEGESELVNSIKSWKPKKSKNGAWIASVKFWGDSKVKMYRRISTKTGVDGMIKVVRRYSVSNALKAIWKEYGIPGRQPARPFITTAVNAAEREVTAKMQEVYNRKVGAE